MQRKQPLPSPIQPHLETSVVLASDLSRQPETKFILIVGAGGERKPNYYAVDDYTAADGVVRFYRYNDVRPNKAGAGGNDLIFACRVEASWSLVNRAVCQIEDERAMMVFAKEDAERRKAFYMDLDPEAYKAAEEEARRPQSPFAFMMPGGGPGAHPQHGPGETSANDKPVPGQYL